MSEKKFGAFLDKSYQKSIHEQLNMEPILAKMVREQAERKENLIRESLHPFRAWLVKKTKWKWLLRSYRVVESNRGDKVMYQIYKGNRLLKEALFESGPTITFKRYSPQAIEPTEVHPVE